METSELLRVVAGVLERLQVRYFVTGSVRSLPVAECRNALVRADAPQWNFWGSAGPVVIQTGPTRSPGSRYVDRREDT